MALQFTPIVFGVMLVVAVGTLAYSIWNINSSKQSYSNSGRSSNDYSSGCDTRSWGTSIEDIPRKRKKQNSEKKHCSICLDVMERKLKTLPCQHVFHEACILVWFNDQSTCPLCRKASNSN